jgi:hypothetical protein
MHFTNNSNMYMGALLTFQNISHLLIPQTKVPEFVYTMSITHSMEGMSIFQTIYIPEILKIWELSPISCVGLAQTICGHILFTQADTNQ